MLEAGLSGLMFLNAPFALCEHTFGSTTRIEYATLVMFEHFTRWEVRAKSMAARQLVNGQPNREAPLGSFEIRAVIGAIKTVDSSRLARSEPKLDVLLRM